MQRAVQERRRGRVAVVVGVLGLAPVLVAGVTAAAVPASAPVLEVVDDAVGAMAEWAVAPADAEGPDGRVSLRHAVDPGRTVRDAIAVTNLGSDPADFVVQVGDGVVGESGAFDVRTDAPVDAGTWVVVEGLDAGGLELDGGQTRVLPVTIAVPEDALPGYHPAGVVVAASRDGGGVTVTHRVGVRLHLEVSGDLEPALTITDVRATYSGSWLPFVPGKVRTEYTLANEGNVRLGGTVRTDTAGPAGVGPRSVTESVVELLPGDAVTRTVEVPAWPLGVLTAGVTATATAVGQDRIPLPPQAGEAMSLVAVPWLELVVILAAVGAAWWLRRRTRAGLEPEGAPAGQPERRASMSSSLVIEDRPSTSSSAARSRSSSTVHSS